jgi:3-dehydroquinate dehydratase II
VGATSHQIEVMHGVNLDQLGHRDPVQYGTLTLIELEHQVAAFAEVLGVGVSFFHTNHEGEFVERLHRVRGQVDGLLLNPGAWTHYSYAIRDALELSGAPAVEVHLSDVDAREEFRRQSVISDLCVGRVKGKGVDGYREALELLNTTIKETSG